MELVTITYRWNDCPNELCEATAAIGEYSGGNDDGIFYWFAPGDAILGNQGEFTVESVAP
jgi:hypothetical protein